LFAPRLSARGPVSPLVVQRGQHEQFAGDERIAALLRELVGEIEQARQIVADVDAAGLSRDLRQLFQRFAEAFAQAAGTLTPACASSGRVPPPC
jgi:hypothetical protein